MNTTTDIAQPGFEQELAQHIISALNLDISPAEIDPLAPLYGDEGLGIDSIDVLEISLVVTKQYGCSTAFRRREQRQYLRLAT
jgi:acyl carrier protein